MLQRADNPRLWWWLSLVSVSCSGIVFCLSTCRRWNSVNEENWQWRYYLVSTFTTIFTNGAFLLATFVLGMVGSLCYWRADKSWLQWWLRSVSVSCAGIVFYLPTGRHWISVDEESWWWRYCLIYTVTTILTIGAFLLVIFGLGMVGSLCYQRADNARLQWWLGSVSVFCFGIVFCLWTYRRWNSVDEEDWHRLHYLRFTFPASLTIGGFLLATFVVGMVELAVMRADNQ